MQDSYKREINYMRVSITDLCNLKCIYCMPKEGVKKLPHKDILRYEDIKDIVAVAGELGINKIRITGGEPLVRKEVDKLIGFIRSVKKIKTIALTTNATLLSPLAERLRIAGLDSINISLDTLDEKRYRMITRGGDIKEAFMGIEKAASLNFPLKINVVIYDELSKIELPKIYEYASSIGAKVQTIKYYDLNAVKEDTYEYDRPLKCEHCNRIRLLANGYLLSCLHSDRKIKVDLNNIKDSLLKAICSKPNMGLYSSVKAVSDIGG